MDTNRQSVIASLPTGRGHPETSFRGSWELIRSTSCMLESLSTRIPGYSLSEPAFAPMPRSGTCCFVDFSCPHLKDLRLRWLPISS